MPSNILSVRDLNAWYGKSHILHGVNIEIRDGELVALLGRNGVGKTTTLKALSGVLPDTQGSVKFYNREIRGYPAHRVACLGVALVPEHRGIFSTLTVTENLSLGMRPGSTWTVEKIEEMFPSLRGRRGTMGGKLSGGEQQMLSIARALLGGPKLLLLDEPTEGLAPVIVDRLVELFRTLKSAGLSMLLVEQNLETCLAVADRFLILDEGSIVWEGDRAAFTAADDVRSRYLTLEHA